MNKKQLDSLSSSLSKAINPAARKIEATGRILERVEPLPVLSKPSQRLQIQYQIEGTMLKQMPIGSSPLRFRGCGCCLWKTPQPK